MMNDDNTGAYNYFTMLVENSARGDRMKAKEREFDIKLPGSKPVILRLDGNSFHAFTRGKFDVPFDPIFKSLMYHSAIAVLDRFPGSRVAYVQSDEISILIINDDAQSPAFNNRVQKICSIAASECSVRFSMIASKTLCRDIEAHFDCRCFILDPADVVDAFIWRQDDAMKNAVNSVLYWKERETKRASATQKFLDGKSTAEKLEMLVGKHGVDINAFPKHFVRGACIGKVTSVRPIEEVVSPEIISKFKKHGDVVKRSRWEIDYNVPIFFDDRQYIEKFLRNEYARREK